MIEIEQRGMLLSADSKPYNVNGNTGVSHKARVLVNGDVYNCRVAETLIPDLQDSIEKFGVATIRISSRKEVLSVELEGFDAE